MEMRQLAIQATIALLVSGLLLAGLLTDSVHSVSERAIPLTLKGESRTMYVSGIRITTKSISLDFNPCDNGIADDARTTRLYSSDGVPMSEVVPGGTRDQSIAEFSYLNLHDEGPEVIGDIGVTESRAKAGRVLLWASFSLQMVVFTLASARLGLRATAFSNWDAPFSRAMHGLMISGGVLTWIGLVYLTSTISILLAHLFREAESRCQIDFAGSGPRHYEMKTLARYVTDSLLPNGATVLTGCLSVGIVVMYFLGLFLRQVGKTNFRSTLHPVRRRSLPWHCRILSFYWVLVLLAVAIGATLLVASVARVRGYELNMFYWNFGARVSQKTGLSRTGTLLDVVQGWFDIFSVPAALVRASVLMWLVLIPVACFASNHPATVFLKAVQDGSTLLILRSVISWVTVVPAPLSIMENPACFSYPPDDGWLHVLTSAESCKDSMFSIHTIFVIVPLVLTLFFLKFSGAVPSKYLWTANLVLIIPAFLTITLVVVSRYQYTADVSIGIFVCILYMLAQQEPYKLMFDEEWNTSVSATQILNEKLLPTLNECVARLEAYNLASKQGEHARLTTDELREIHFLYRTVGDAIGIAKLAGSTATQSSAIVQADVDNKKDR